jgi:hypothetical protein
MPITIAYQSSGAAGAVIGANPYSFTATATSTSNAIASTGIFQAYIDFSNMGTSDAYELTVWEKAHANATQQLMDSWIYTYPLPDNLVVTPSLVLSEGWDFRLTRIGGATSTTIGIPYSVRKIA